MSLRIKQVSRPMSPLHNPPLTNLPTETATNPLTPVIAFPEAPTPGPDDSLANTPSDVEGSEVGTQDSDTDDEIDTLEDLKEANKRWASSMPKKFFQEGAQGQQPRILWIGCSDSRVVPSTILQLSPGEIFEHRNIANVFPIADFNSLSVLDYAINVLKVKHVIVCGHLGCGGIQTALQNKQFGLIDNWLRYIKEIYGRQYSRLNKLDKTDRLNFLTELNVAKSVFNVAQTTIVQNAWQQGQDVTLHGWIYNLHDGLIYDLHLNIDSPDQISPAFHMFEHGADIRATRRKSMTMERVMEETFGATALHRSRSRVVSRGASPLPPRATHETEGTYGDAQHRTRAQQLRRDESLSNLSANLAPISPKMEPTIYVEKPRTTTKERKHKKQMKRELHGRRPSQGDLLDHVAQALSKLDIFPKNE